MKKEKIRDEQMKFKFIDLFAGIGGFHLAMHRLGGECVFASEIDEHARKTYEHNFRKISPKLFESDNFNKDIRSIDASEIPDFDILCGGFPCQPFSQAGLKRGFEDNHNSERGNLFFYIAEILQEKKPKAFFLENVRGLLKHDNGNTFKVIRNILENELGYSFYYKIVQACDYGLPQLRPRLFMVGFRDEYLMKSFSFPGEVPLKYTMSDVWGGNCTRDIGFTLRVGGRGSNIDDKRNWDHYRVDGVVKRLGVNEGKMMQGFPNDFVFPVSETQAMKQLGNSVAVDAIEMVGANILKNLSNLTTNNTEVKTTKNKGEWSELFVFLKSLIHNKIYFGDKTMSPTSDYFEIKKVSNQNLKHDFIILSNSTIAVKNKNTGEIKNIDISSILNDSVLNSLRNEIYKGSGTFNIESFNFIQDKLGINLVKGGNSNQKADICYDISCEHELLENEGFGIKSYLGSKPTLLNASGNTNFIFKVSNIGKETVDEINKIETVTKLKDRIEKIKEMGGVFTFERAEKETMEFNLKMVDSKMPELVGEALLAFYQERISSIDKVVDYICKNRSSDDKLLIENNFKKLLVSILLGFFAGSKWDGEYSANGTVVLKYDGDLVGYHIVKLATLKDYLYNSIKFDTPSTSRHMFGKLYTEKNGNLYFKLNMQLRF